ncbi:MAG: hypothetical protein IJY63_01545 [Clostridia bacterium]|nr:hypothetical protein [Clostridia bacterium]MBQ8876212.1 hypothetical protein [Clostridia bacterium]
MNKKLFITAVCFLFAIVLALTAAHVFDVHAAAPTFLPTRIERRLFPPVKRIR